MWVSSTMQHNVRCNSGNVCGRLPTPLWSLNTTTLTQSSVEERHTNAMGGLSAVFCTGRNDTNRCVPVVLGWVWVSKLPWVVPPCSLHAELPPVCHAMHVVWKGCEGGVGPQMCATEHMCLSKPDEERCSCETIFARVDAPSNTDGGLPRFCARSFCVPMFLYRVPLISTADRREDCESKTCGLCDLCGVGSAVVTRGGWMSRRARGQQSERRCAAVGGVG